MKIIKIGRNFGFAMIHFNFEGQYYYPNNFCSESRRTIFWEMSKNEKDTYQDFIKELKRVFDKGLNHADFR